MIKVYRIIALMLLILLVRWIITMIMGLLNMGDNFNPEQVRLNEVLSYILEFPLVLIESHFPKVISHIYFWSFQNLLFIAINTFIQACGLYFFGQWVYNKPKNPK
ncbi:hypothetical protein [Winogradskyella tangerina]|uniref:hypothetical protein n=1 Tax=Winogradskyella tangerina TaxID=2023240 RepID=UPI000DBE6DE4|nr:hypothetical protein [Winogradskyella tangerina]